MKPKLETLDECCGNPPGTFEKMLEEKDRMCKLYEQHRKDRIHAIRNNLPVPELGFEMPTRYLV
jgi:hypothetical protein